MISRDKQILIKLVDETKLILQMVDGLILKLLLAMKKQNEQFV